MSEWIDCNEMLPDDEDEVICSGFMFNTVGGCRWVQPSIFYQGVFYPYQDPEDDDLEHVSVIGNELHYPTHWQYLPEPPK